MVDGNFSHVGGGEMVTRFLIGLFDFWSMTFDLFPVDCEQL